MKNGSHMYDVTAAEIAPTTAKRRRRAATLARVTPNSSRTTAVIANMYP